MRFLLVLLFPIIALADVKPANNHKVYKIMVMDTGVTKHELIRDYLVKNSDTPDNCKMQDCHGTHVAGITIFGDSFSSYRPVAVCGGNVLIYSCKVWSERSSDYEVLSKTVKCIHQAIEMKIDYINYSIIGGTPSVTEYAAWRDALDAGINVYVSAGNNGQDLNLTGNLMFPANYKIPNPRFNFPLLYDMHVVTNTHRDRRRDSTSNYGIGTEPAVGTDVLSLYSNNALKILSGTSMASPMALHNALEKRCRDDNK